MITLWFFPLNDCSFIYLFMKLKNVMGNSNRLTDHTWVISKVFQFCHSSLCPPTPCVTASTLLYPPTQILLTDGASSGFSSASQWASDVPIIFSTAWRRPCSCQWISHFLIFTDWFIAAFSLVFSPPFLLFFSPPLPPFLHPVSSQTNYLVIPVLLHLFPNAWHHYICNLSIKCH